MPSVLTDFIGNFEYKNFTPMMGCGMRLPRIHQEYKQILYESDSGHLGDDFRAVWDELRMLKQHCWYAFSIRYPQSFSDNSSFSTEYYLQEERFEQKIRDLANKLIGIRTKIRSPDAEEMKFYIKIF